MANRVLEILENPNKVLKHIRGVNFDNVLVYLAGSITEGFGNATSDIDVYVVCEEVPSTNFNKGSDSDEAVLLTPQSLIYNIVDEGLRYDFEYWSWNDFNNIINLLNNLDFATENYIERLSDDEYDLMHRFKYSKPLCNYEKYKEIYNSVNFYNLSYYRAIIQSEKYTGLIEDIQGALMSADFGTAFFLARKIIDIVVTSYLALNDETNPNPKWLYRKLLRYQEKTSDTTLLELYIKFNTSEFYGTDIKIYTREVLKFCQGINIKIQNALKEKQLNIK